MATARFKNFKVNANLGLGIDVNPEVDEIQRKAVWEIS